MTPNAKAQQLPATKGPRNKRLTRTALASIFLIVVTAGCWFGILHIENRSRENVGESLTVLVDTIRDALREWHYAEQDFAQRMARYPVVVNAAEELLANSDAPDKLIANPAFDELRNFFSNRESSRGDLGIFLISPQGLNLFSMRDSNVGVRNLIAEQRPEVLEQVLGGASVLIPPVASDVALGESSAPAAGGDITMFVATPVTSASGDIIAILTVRLDPSADFTRIIRTGRIGKSGESYAFDRQGLMLSESRFDPELVEIGLLDKGEQSILTISITDPGRRLSKQDPAEEQATKNFPLTLMAAAAAAGESGSNVSGYRDYRGEKVLGAWLWDPLLNIGITSEIDQREALAVFRTTRNIIVSILAMALLLALLLAAYLAKLDEKEHASTLLFEEKAAVELAANAKTEFLAHMSHEIRTPLNAIIGFSQLLRRDDSLNEENRRTVRTIERSGNHLLTLINDILEMSKIEAGQLTLNTESVSLKGIAEDMREMMGFKASQKGLRFELVWDDALPEYVDIDSGKFRQIVLNLLSNAVKFTDSGVVKLIFSSVEDPQVNPESPSLRVEVIDSGTGISEQDQQKLFGAFYQSDSGRRQQGGTGLGLAISSKFADYLGGDLQLSSSLGEGSTFTLRLPLEHSTNLGQRMAAESASAAGRSALNISGLDLEDGKEAPKILVAEDHPANRELMQRLLGDIGFDIRFAENGRKAIELVDTWKPDFVWMDLKMPEMDGDEATRLIRQKHGDSLPVVALTASVLTVNREALMSFGFSELLMKPIKPNEIFDTMAKFLGIRYVEEKSVSAPPPAEEPSTFRRLADLPDELKARFQKCIDLGDLEGIKHSVEEVRAIDPDLAEALTEPLANFAFGSIAAAMNAPNS